MRTLKTSSAISGTLRPRSVGKFNAQKNVFENRSLAKLIE
jgi:hypothetical protein